VTLSLSNVGQSEFVCSSKFFTKQNKTIIKQTLQVTIHTTQKQAFMSLDRDYIDVEYIYGFV